MRLRFVGVDIEDVSNWAAYGEYEQTNASVNP
jgi:hypothetical protein